LIGVIPEQIDSPKDYRDVEGVKLPFTIRLSSVDPGNPISTRKFGRDQIERANRRFEVHPAAKTCDSLNRGLFSGSSKSPRTRYERREYRFSGRRENLAVARTLEIYRSQ
jgi:hypothetical protein